MTLMQFCVTRYIVDRVNLSDGAAQQIKINVQSFENSCDSVLQLEEIKPEHIRKMMKDLIRAGRSARTANNKRSTVLTLLRSAAASGLCQIPPKVERAEEPRRSPKAWTPCEMNMILVGTDLIKWPEGWSAAHMRALLLAIYDTSHRVGAILKADKPQLDRNGRLHMYAEQTKQKADTIHTLHPETLEAIAQLPRSRSTKLFPWPKSQRRLYEFLRRLLQKVGLPCTRRDLFHKFRRTSYTLVWATSGADAASKHAGHATNLQRAYLDLELARQIRGEKSPIDLMPRPAA